MEKRSTSKRQEEKIRMLSSQYDRLQRAWSENAMLFHDMDNHLQTICHLAENGSNEEIRRYISRISRPVEPPAGILHTGVGIVDAVLNAKKRQAQEKGCRMDINAQLPANTGIDEDDFCTILTSLLDNAMESMDRERAHRGRVRGGGPSGERSGGERGSGTAPAEGERPVISVSLRRIQHFLVICVSHPCAETPARGWNLLATSGQDRLRHRRRLKRVRRAVEKYKGSLSLAQEDGRFVAAAMLFFPDGAGKDESRRRQY